MGNGWTKISQKFVLDQLCAQTDQASSLSCHSGDISGSVGFLSRSLPLCNYCAALGLLCCRLDCTITRCNLLSVTTFLQGRWMTGALPREGVNVSVTCHKRPSFRWLQPQSQLQPPKWWSVMTGDLSWRWSLKAGYAVTQIIQYV